MAMRIWNFKQSWCCETMVIRTVEGNISVKQLPYILESNPHTFYSFRGLKNQMRIRIACGLDSRS